jgi:MFS family permease
MPALSVHPERPMSDRSHFSPRLWAVLLILCGAIFLEGMDAGMLNLALPSIRAELGLSTTELSAIASTYVLGYAGFMLLGGRAADLFGRRRVFLLALVVFLAFSGLGGLATDGLTIILARFVTGVAAAFMTPAGLSLVTTSFPEGPARDRAVLIYGAAGAAGFSLGLVIGGILTSFGWRWVFFVPVIMSAAILALAFFLIEEKGERETGRTFDIAGAVTLTGAMLAAAFAVTRLEHAAADMWPSLGSFILSLVLASAFVAIERRSADPLIRLGIFRHSGLVRTNIAGLLFVGAFFSFQFLASIYLQELLGWTAWQTALVLIVVALDGIIAPTLTPVLVERFGHARVILGGLVCAVAGYLFFLRLGFDWTYASMLPSTVLLGLSFSFVYGPLTIAATDGVADREQGLAGGLINTSFQFGAGLGLAITSVVISLALQGETPDQKLEAIRAALLIPVIATFVALVLTGFAVRTSVRRPSAA